MQLPMTFTLEMTRGVKLFLALVVGLFLTIGVGAKPYKTKIVFASEKDR